MPIQTRYLHSIEVHRLAPDDPVVYDEWNQPVIADSTVATVPGLVQPRRAVERPETGEAGVVLGSFVAFIDPLPELQTGDWFVVSGKRYDVVGIADAAGVGHHYEVELKQAAGG